MSSGLPEFGNPLLLAQSGKRFSGRLALSRFGRLAGSLAKPLAREDAVDYSIELCRNEDGKPVIRGRVRGALPQVCQRCLETFRLPVDRAFNVVLITDPAEEKLLGDSENARLVPDGEMRLADLLEDEMILALPLVPRHPASGECRMPAFDEAEPEAKPDNEPGPFDKLEKLKRNDQE